MAPVSPPETTFTANGIGCEESCEGEINAYFFWCAHKRQIVHTNVRKKEKESCEGEINAYFSDVCVHFEMASRIAPIEISPPIVPMRTLREAWL